MADDHLAKLSEKDLAAWYGRLADGIATRTVNGSEPLSSQLLRQWLRNRDPAFKFALDPPAHLTLSDYVDKGQQFHRDVFLTNVKGRFTPKPDRWAGILPRLQGLPGFTKWDLTKGPLDLKYQSLIEVGPGIMDIARIQTTGSEEEKDLFTGLRGFQLVSMVIVAGTAITSSANVKISFQQWTAQVLDRYDWDYSEHLTVPNPDFGSTAAGAVRPKDQQITVFHTNAERLEKKGLVAPFDIESKKWFVMRKQIVADAEVDPNRKLN